ncbi:MAG: 16S rRNA (adenine(1518)-N(6)/adenine(1519)-N(6))-dimethyltransferase RsmA [Thiohalocapsa sp.]
MDHRPRKRFGQNFLHDPGTIRRILAAVSPQPGQHLVEIGPGQGALTEGLLARTGVMDVVEIDRDLVGPLAQRLNALGELRIHNANALRFDLCQLLSGTRSQKPSPDSPRLRIVGNLPYNISTPLLFRFLDQAHCIDDLHLMLQKEVVDRICADPGSKTYGRLSVMVQTWCSAERLLVIGPGAFNPPPKVDSAVVRLVPHRPLVCPVDDSDLHARIVSAAFAQRRKTLRNSLKGLVDSALLVECGLDPAARAETIPVYAYARLSNLAIARASVARQSETRQAGHERD